MEARGFAIVAKIWAVSALLMLLALPACGGGEQARSGARGASSGGEAEEVGGARMQAGSDSPLAVSEVGVSESQVGESTLGDFDRKVVKTADLGIRSEDVRRSAAQAQQVAAQLGGSVLSSRINQGGGSVYADLVLSVPSPEFEKALDELRSLGKEVTTDTVGGEDVTEEFVDLESRERNLLATEESLLELYDEAQDVNDTLLIQRELTNVRGEIEQVQGRINYLEERTAFSQITLSIQPVVGPTPSRPAWSPAAVAAQAWNASLRVLQTLATAVISIIVFGWWLVPALIAGFAWWRSRNRSSSPAASGPSQVR